MKKELKQKLWNEYLCGHYGALITIEEFRKNKDIIITKELDTKINKAWILCDRIMGKNVISEEEDSYNGIMCEIIREIIGMTQIEFDTAWDNDSLSGIITL